MIRTGRFLFWTAMIAWVGGLAVLAFVVAPVTFRTAPSREIAGTIFGRILWAFNKVEFGCAAAAFAGALLMMHRPPSKRDWLRPALVLVMAGIVAAIGFWLLPSMDAARGVSPGRFDELHALSTKLYGATILTGIIATSMTALERPS